MPQFLMNRPVETESGLLFNIPSCFQLGGGKGWTEAEHCISAYCAHTLIVWMGNWYDRRRE
jgi:hypothetical protein